MERTLPPQRKRTYDHEVLRCAQVTNTIAVTFQPKQGRPPRTQELIFVMKSALHAASSNGSRKIRQDGPSNDQQRRPIICLTGFPKEEKDVLHAWIDQLGGVYVFWYLQY